MHLVIPSEKKFKMRFDPVQEPTVTLIVQYPNTPEMYVCKASFTDDLEFAILQATFAIKEQIKIQKDEKRKEKEAKEQEFFKHLDADIANIIREYEESKKNDDTF